ncbi:hypothetical protein HYX10_00710 [Candidatus Woesearchaeota archaeon]|nr:hypothetical protein [Candidatus Woesearchaeota archaeon]
MILLDTNILSTFGKIGRLGLLFEALGDNLVVSPNVLSEVKKAKELGYDHAKIVYSIFAKGKIRVVQMSDNESAYAGTLPKSFGSGERDTASIAKCRKAAVVTNEKKIINFCQREGIAVISLNSVLRHLWAGKILSKSQVEQLIDEMELKDNLIIISREEILSD